MRILICLLFSILSAVNLTFLLIGYMFYYPGGVDGEAALAFIPLFPMFVGVFLVLSFFFVINTSKKLFHYVLGYLLASSVIILSLAYLVSTGKIH